MNPGSAENEAARLWALRVKELLASEPEQECAELTHLASALCDVPLGFVTLLDEKQQWYRASEPLKVGDTPRESAFCAHTVRQDGVLVVKDSLLDNRFGTNPLVIADPPIRFFAGVSLVAANGNLLGTLSVLDSTPRILSSEQSKMLTVLGSQVTARLELTMQRRALAQALQDKERATNSLHASEELFRAFMNASPFLSYLKDATGRLLFYNRAFAQHFGVSEQAWLGRTDEQLWSRKLSKSVHAHDLEVMAGGHMVETEEHIRGTDGTISFLRSFKFPCSHSAGNVLLAGLAVDISEEVAHKTELERYHRELEEANEQLRRLAVTDELTGLRNRRAFEERLVMEFSMARRRSRDLAVVLIDIDDFKNTNDKYGHAAGDEVLRRLGMILRTTVRLPDLPARYGGEEFVVLLPESGEGAAMGLARRIMARIAAEEWENELITISMGMAAMNESLVSGYQLVELADEALYAAKRAGKNRFMVHSSG